jgi:3-phosphoshikimate 1-carboxyvinyltransferase
MPVAPFQFQGSIDASKSLLNRWLVVASFAEKPLEIRGEAACEDVEKMRAALTALSRGNRELDVGEAGAVLRFLAFRVSREKGEFLLTGKPRLFERPQAPLVDLLSQLGVQAETLPGALRIRSQGWKRPAGPLRADRRQSSQFISGLLLSSWLLDFPLVLQSDGVPVSESYWKMSRRVALKAGLKLSGSAAGVEILAWQRVRLPLIEVEPDYSSVFAVAALAAVGGEATIENSRADHFQDPLQPDAGGIDILRRMGADVKNWKGSYRAGVGIPERLIVRAPAEGQKLRATDADLREAPDLFPVLAATAALAEGDSLLHGAPHLRHKESDRIAEVERLFRICGIECEGRDDGMKVRGTGGRVALPESKDFDPAGDHRMVMAAAVLRQAGYPLRILNTRACHKSFPAFPKIAGLEGT